MQPCWVQDSGYRVMLPLLIFIPGFWKRTFLTWTSTSAWEPLSCADITFTTSTAGEE